jgi:hypothetical protein
MVETNATPSEIRNFFEAGTGVKFDPHTNTCRDVPHPKVEVKELMRLKKTADGTPLPDYDQVASGIKNGSLTY